MSFSLLIIKLEHFSVIKNLFYIEVVVKWPLGGAVSHRSTAMLVIEIQHRYNKIITENNYMNCGFKNCIV